MTTILHRLPPVLSALSVLLVLAAHSGAHVDRSPVDLVLAPDGSWLVTINQTSGTASLVDVDTGRVLDEVVAGHRPAAGTLVPATQRVLITASYSGELVVLEVQQDKLVHEATIWLGGEPLGVAATADGQLAYVAQTAKHQIAVVDLDRREVIDHIAVGRWPGYLALSPDHTRLVVGTPGDRGVSVVDTQTREMLYQERFVGLNIGHLVPSADSQYVYFPWMVYRQNPITVSNIREGWVLASRIARVRLDGPARREALSLDPQGKAIADPHGMATSSDEQTLVASAAGTHELLIYRLTDLPLQDYGGTDHIPPELLEDADRFHRIELGGRPMGLRMADDDRTVYVANYLENAVQVVDLDERRLTRTISLGSAMESSLARRGEALFFDARRSLDQWYSCHTCHYEGGSNAERMDTFNDGSRFTFKTVLPLYHVTDTAPWTWHGWQTDLADAVRTSITSTMQGEDPQEEDVEALIAYLEQLQEPPNPFRQRDGSLTPAAQRGKVVFESDRAGCVNCHSGPHFTDGQIHDVGLSSPRDRYPGFNTPSLRGVYRKVRLLHDGRAESLEEVLTGDHDPAKVMGQGELSQQELGDLIEYLNSL